MNRRKNKITGPSSVLRRLCFIWFCLCGYDLSGTENAFLLPGGRALGKFICTGTEGWERTAGIAFAAGTCLFFLLKYYGVIPRRKNKALAAVLCTAGVIWWKWDRRKKLIWYYPDLRKAARRVPEDVYFAAMATADRNRIMALCRKPSLGAGRIREEFRVVDAGKGLKKKVEWAQVDALAHKRDSNGCVRIFSGTYRTITDIKLKETELEKSRAEAQESNRLKSAFLANMSHEIRSPLSAIVGFSRMLAEQCPGPESREYVSIIETNNNLLLQLISDILDLAKIEAGTIEFIYSDFDVKELVQGLESSMRLRVQSKEVALYAEPGLSSYMIHAERNRLSQLLINLLTNAVKFTSRGVIRFGYERRGEFLRFYVCDTGCGIPLEKQETIFGRFVKLNTGAQGTGLGLAICRNLVEMMGGKIGVRSKVGEGSVFWFEIPYVPSFSGAAPQQ